MPVYNVEAYLVESLDSLLKQTYKNFEILLVNDASTDQSGEICKNYQQDYTCIKAINHPENRGVSAARNTGLDWAMGDYIIFVDSDDIVDNHFLEYLITTLNDNNAQIVLCDYAEFFQPIDVKRVLEKNSLIQIEEITKESYMESLSFVGYDYQHIKDVILWNKLFQKELFDDLRFENVAIGEDDLMIHKLIDRAEVILYLKLPLYHYRIRSDSLIRTKNRKYNKLEEIAIITAFRERLYLCERKYPSIFSKMLEGYLLTLSYQLFKMKQSKQKQRVLEIKALMEQVLQKYQKELSKAKKWKFLKVVHFPNVSYWNFTMSQFFLIKTNNLKRRFTNFQ